MEYNDKLRGDEGALKRALYKSMGHTDNDFKKPVIGIANSYTNATPGQYNLRRVTEHVISGIKENGGFPLEFGVIGPCDGIAAGNDGMKYILPSREIIASSIECMARAHNFDAIVLIGSCDKIVPGMLMAAAVLDIPAIFINGGPMKETMYKGQKYDGNIVTEAIGWKNKGKISEEEFKHIIDIAEPGPGSCAMLGTANTMAAVAEALGMSLPDSAFILAEDDERYNVAYKTGKQIVSNAITNLTARKIMSREAFNNAIVTLMAIGGSTNGILHLQAIYNAAGYGELSLETFDEYSQKIPLIASVYPASKFTMSDFYYAGGVQRILKELREYIKDTPTVSQFSQYQLIDKTPIEKSSVIRPYDDPFLKDGGVAVLKGNLAIDGCVCKPAAIPQNLQYLKAGCRVFDYEIDACHAIENGEITPNTILLIRYEGPKGSPGFPEMYLPMKLLEGYGLSDTCALITDGRFSGSNRGLFVGHISPEAVEGSLLAYVKDGDIIEIDITSRSINVHIEEEELKKRKNSMKVLEKEVPRGILRTYRQNANSASKGATWKQ